MDCKEVTCCCIYDNQNLKISIFCTGSHCGFVQFVIRLLEGYSKCLTFCTFEIWEIWHSCVKVSNIATNFVVKRCKYKYMYWIAFCRCSRAIWIASERTANSHAQLTRCIIAILSDAGHMVRKHRQNAIQCLREMRNKFYKTYRTLNLIQ